MTALLRRSPGISSKAFRRQIEDDLAGRLHRKRDDLALASLKVYRDASARGILSLILQLTRSQGYTAFLCRALGNPPPPPCRLRYGVHYDIVLQVTFGGQPEPSQLGGVLELLRSADVSAAECTIVASGKQYTVYDSQPTGDESRRVNICFLINRPKKSTRAACQAHWRIHHADLVLRNMQHIGLTRYRQVHTIESPPSGFDDTYDGVVFAERSSVGSFLLASLKPNGLRVNNTLIIDETNFTECTPIMLMRFSSGW